MKEEKKQNFIEIQEDVRLPNSDIILEKGDKIEILPEQRFDFDCDDISALVMLARYAVYSRDFMGFPPGSTMERQFDAYLNDAQVALKRIERDSDSRRR